MLSLSKMDLKEVWLSSPTFLLRMIMLPKRELPDLLTSGFSLVGTKWAEGFTLGSLTKPQRNAAFIYSSYICISQQDFAVCLELYPLELRFPQELNKDDAFLNSVLRVRCLIIKCFKFRLFKSFAVSSLEPWAVTWWFQVAGQLRDAVNLENISVFSHNYSHVIINHDVCVTFFWCVCASSVDLKYQYC